MCERVLWYEGCLVNNGCRVLVSVIIGGEGVGEESWDVEAVPSFGFFIVFEVRVASLVVVRHALVMVRAIVFTAKAGVLEGMFAGLCRVACRAWYKCHKLALSNEVAVEEGGE